VTNDSSTGPTGYEDIRYLVGGDIGRITLARPDRLNALSYRTRREIVHALKSAESDPDVNVVLIDAEGPSFCAGYDLSDLEPSEGERRSRGWVEDPRLSEWTDQALRSIWSDWQHLWDLLKPVVVAVQGNCLAGGAELISMADIVFAADDARLGYPPMRAMSTPDVPFFPWKMTMARAKYLQLTGNSITGKTAADWGWIAKSFRPDELQDRVMDEVNAFASIAPDLLAANKHQLNAAFEIMGMRTHFEQAWSWHHLSARVRPNAMAFFKVAHRDGMRAALDWMNAPFRTRGID
jgi:enoyl-CoA hydratase